MNALQNALIELGLDTSDRAIYLRLLDRKYTSVSDVAVDLGISRQTLYNKLHDLAKDGLVEKYNNRWYAARPSLILSRLETKAFNLNQHKYRLQKEIGDWEHMWRTAQPLLSSTIYRGVDAFKGMYDKILTSNTDIYSIGNIELLFDIIGLHQAEQWIARRLHKFQSHSILHKSSTAQQFLKKNIYGQNLPDITLVDFPLPTQSVICVYNGNSVMIFKLATQEVIEIEDQDFANLIMNMYSFIAKSVSVD